MAIQTDGAISNCAFTTSLHFEIERSCHLTRPPISTVFLVCIYFFKIYLYYNYNICCLTLVNPLVYLFLVGRHVGYLQTLVWDIAVLIEDHHFEFDKEHSFLP